MFREPPATLSRLMIVASLAAGIALPGRAFASLGDEVASIERDRVALTGTHTVAPGPAFEVHDLAVPGGHVKEYVAAGRVFAIAWSGASTPDLSQLLGAYHDAYGSLVKPQPGRHHAVAVDSDSLVIRVSKLPRGIEGKVLVPSLAPAGVTIATLP